MTLFRDVGLVLGLLCLSLLPRLALLYSKGFEIFHADHAVFGLMAKHILEGRPMVYYYGQGYMGSIEAFMAALIYLFRGMDLYSVLLAPLAFYLLFLIVNFYLLKRVFGFKVSLMANLLLALSSPHLTALSVTALGGYPETLFFGSLTLLGLFHSLESKRNRWVLFLTGLVAGVGFWTNNLILMYFLAVGGFALLRSKLWKDISDAGGLRRIFLLKDVKIPAFLRGAGIAVHAGILLFLLWNLLAFFVGDTLALGNFRIEMASPPFLVKKVKKILLLLAGEFSLFSLLILGVKKIWDKTQRVWPLVGGFLLGASPVILHSLFGGEGYRVIHGSGMVHATDLLLNLRRVIWTDFVEGVWAVPIGSLGPGSGIRSIWSWVILVISLGFFISCGLGHKKEIGNLIRLRPFRYSYSIFPLLLTIIVLGICLLSDLKAGRYLIPAYFSVSLIFAWVLSRIKWRKGLVAWVLLFLLLANHAWANLHFIREIPSQEKLRRGYEAILQFLSDRGIRGAYAHYIFSYVLTLESRERVIVAPYRSPDRYPPYTEAVDRLSHVAYLFEEQDSFIPTFQQTLDEKRISYEKVWLAPFWVFVIDRTRGTEKGVV